jgi:propionate CoA-transferase
LTAFSDEARLDLRGECLNKARRWSLNVSRFGTRLAGAGGFINISRNAKKVVFVGTFTAGKLQIAVQGGQLRILREGDVRKFVHAVEHRTYSGAYGVKRGQEALFVTERCVLRLGPEGLELSEVAPGIDVERDILAHMEFLPLIKAAPRIMDRRIFAAEPMGLRADLLQVPLEQRFTYDPQQDIFFANFEGISVRDKSDVERIRALLEMRLIPLGRKVPAIVDYDNFTVSPDAEDAFFDMARAVSQHYYLRVTRYTTSAFLRAKLGDALSQRQVAPHIFESAEDARQHLDTLACIRD